MKVDVVSSIVIQRPRGMVANYAANPDNAPRWYVNIKRVEWKTPPPLRIGSRIAFVARFLGRTLSYTYQVIEYIPEEYFVMRTARPSSTVTSIEQVSGQSWGHTARTVSGTDGDFTAIDSPSHEG